MLQTQSTEGEENSVRAAGDGEKENQRENNSEGLSYALRSTQKGTS